MNSSDRLRTHTKVEFLTFLEREITSAEEFQDKLRALIILVQCSDEIDLIKKAIGVVKEMHQEDYFDP